MEKLLEVLSSVGIIIKARNGQLEILDPNKKITPQIVDSIKLNKAELLKLLEGFKNKKKEDIILLQEDKEYYSLSAAQKRLYFLYELDRSSTAYNVTQYFKLYGELTLDKINEVVAKLIDRHENLRTSFITINDEPKQRIQKKVNFKIDFIKLEKGQNTNDLLRSILTPFNLQKAPLLKLAFIEIAMGSYILMVDMHHIITDGVSSGIIVKDFVKFYNDENLPNVRIRYKDYSEWQNLEMTQEKIQKQKEWWLNTFKQEPTTLNLPIDFNRPKVMTSEGETINFNLTKAVSNELKKIASNENTTLFTVLIAILNILLSRICNTNDIVIGTPIAGRRNIDLEQTLGMFVNTLALRNFPYNNLNYVEFLSQVKSNVLKAFDNQDFQFEELINELKITRDTSRQPLFDVMFVLNNFNKKELVVPNLVVEPIESAYQNTKFDLTFNCYNSDQELQFSLQYYKPIFKRDTIERLIMYFENIIHSIIKDKNIKISEIQLLPEDEKQKILYEFNNTKRDFPKCLTLIDLFEDQVNKTERQVAVVFENQKLTYAELNQKANKLANYLKRRGVVAGDTIGLYVERSLEMVIGIFAALKAGCAYCPISIEAPLSRLRFLLNDCQLHVVLTQESVVSQVSQIEGIDTILIDSDTYKNEDEKNLKIKIRENSPAYIIYTSGSTGNPKGVLVNHNTIINTLFWNNRYYNFSAGDCILQILPISFDSSVESIFATLLFGLKLVVANEKDKYNLTYLNKTICEQKVNSFLMTPKLYFEFLDHIDIEKNTLSKVVIAGESFTSVLISKHFNKLPNVKLFNGYGPTENSVCTTIYDLVKNKEQILIGKPIDNVKCYILDENLQLSPIGVSGELCISGAGVAEGYINNPELTNEVFKVNPYSKQRMYKTGDVVKWTSNGNIEFLGRVDNQVKIRGYRIELGEIEEILSKHEHIKESVVIANNDGSNNILVGYYASEIELEHKLVRNYMLQHLPDYMVPAFFVELDKIPLTSNGKVDKSKLPKHKFKKNTDFVAPQSELEKGLAKIWEEVLELNGYEVSVYDNFFELGGNSISLLTLNNKIRKNLTIDLSIGDLMGLPTINSITTFLNKPKENTNQMKEKAKKAVDVKHKTLDLLSKLNR